MALSEDHKRAISRSMKGRKQDPEHTRAAAEAKKKGEYKPCDGCGEEIYVPKWKMVQQPNHYCSHECYLKNRIPPRGEDHPNWNGDSYDGAHQWISKHFSDPGACEECGHDGRWSRLEWAQKHGVEKSTRKREDYRRLCAKCHWHYDRG